MGKMSNWDKLKNRNPNDTIAYRDVYSDQQLDRTRIGALKTMKSRVVADIAMTIFIFFVFWLIYSFFEYAAFLFNGGRGTAKDMADAFGVARDIGYFIRHVTFIKVLMDFIFSGAFFGIMYFILWRNLEVQNAKNTTEDVNNYQNDQHVALPEELQVKFDFFPDVGATSDVQFSSMISHMALSNKGLKTIKVAKRVKKDVLDEDGDILIHKGEILRDENDEIVFEEQPMIDTEFMHALFDASGLPNDKSLRKFWNPTLIPYNEDGSSRDKLGKYKTVADLINADWQFPSYEPQRPGGAYLVDTAPVNTMVLAITRAGKGQTVIEPTLDMWTRERRPNNMVINDPKGELLVKFYVRGTVRGFQIVQFNLINAVKTDIYNPLGLAADAAREGDFTKAALYVENIAEVFFPLDGGEDPVWPNARLTFLV